jgi:hypothetical protein
LADATIDPHFVNPALPDEHFQHAGHGSRLGIQLPAELGQVELALILFEKP